MAYRRHQDILRQWKEKIQDKPEHIDSCLCFEQDEEGQCPFHCSFDSVMNVPPQ